LSAGVMLVQEKLKIEPFAIAFWNKVAVIVFLLPVACYFGFPDQPAFYALVFANAVIWVISDVIFFGAVAKSGAGVISRLMPISVIVTFCVWFLFDPALFHTYLETPVRSALILLTLCASVWFAMQLKHCPVSWQALRLVWFVLFAAVIGPIMFKLIAQHTDIQ